jgi:hypothetical protein
MADPFRRDRHVWLRAPTAAVAIPAALVQQMACAALREKRHALMGVAAEQERHVLPSTTHKYAEGQSVVKRPLSPVDRPAVMPAQYVLQAAPISVVNFLQQQPRRLSPQRHLAFRVHL